MWCYSKIDSNPPLRNEDATISDEEYEARLKRAEEAVAETRRIGREMDAIGPEDLNRRVK